MKTLTGLAVLTACGALAGLAAAHQPQPSQPAPDQASPLPDPPASPSSAPTPVPEKAATRRDLALAFMRFDRAFMAHRPEGDAIPDINRRFDAATLQFFSGNMNAVISAVDDLTAALIPAANAPEPPPATTPVATPITPAIDPTELNRARDSLHAAITAITDPPAELRTALSIANARVDLLLPEGSASDSAIFLSNPAELLPAVSAEVSALAQGRNPYCRFTGELWRPIVLEGANIPCRVYAPPLVAGDKPLPLVVVLHGAGGDEAMFMETYGAGQIKALADRHGFIVASPLTYPLLGDPRNFDALLAQLSADYAIDPTRIYVLGHSMGAGAASMLAVSRSSTFAGAACICGGGAFRVKNPPCPVLVIAGELDPIMRTASLRAGAEKAAKAGLPVEFQEYKGYGHTLTVNASLPSVIDWLLARRRAELNAPK